MAERGICHNLDEVRVNAVSVIDDLRWSDAFEPLVTRALRDPSAKVRRRVLELLSYVSNPVILEAIANMTSDPDPEIRGLANNRLKKLAKE